MRPRETRIIDNSNNIVMILDDYVACLEKNQQRSEEMPRKHQGISRKIKLG